MKIQMLLLSGILSLSIGAAAQTDVLLQNPLPKTKEEFIASEPIVINTVNYLETTPIDKEGDAWRVQAALLTAWLTNSPQVTIRVDAKIIKFADKNPPLIIVFMGGWTRYMLQNGYSKDEVKGNAAGIKSAIKVYKMGNGFKKDKEMEKLVKLDESGGLEDWVAGQLGKKG
ncbi:MAG TPA: hypothetical protein VNW04_13570 [Puia sp.]|jgi:hypothetical protein|nr:hypothetical protein [Puia sp.]